MTTEERIQKEISETMFMNGGNSESEKAAFRQGAEFGAARNKENAVALEKEIQRLKEIIKDLYLEHVCFHCDAATFEQYKTENNL